MKIKFYSLLLGASLALSAAANAANFTLACGPRNDLYLTMKACGLKPARCDSPSEALLKAKAGSMVLLLDDAYPTNALVLTDSLYDQAAARHLRLFVEYPSLVPGIKFDAPRKTSWERFIINGAGLGTNLPKGRLLMAQECEYLPAAAADSLVVVGRVAGFDNAVFGIPANAQPILFPLDSGRVLVATTKLSSFVTSRFAPTKEWEALWNFILGTDKLRWQPRVQAMYGPTETLPANFEQKAFQYAANWWRNSGLLISQRRLPELQKSWSAAAELVETPKKTDTSGDGRLGILEGFNSVILPDGSQRQRAPVRNDCQAESAMVLAMDWNLNHHHDSRNVSSNLLDFIYFNSDLCKGDRGNPRNPAFGLIAWGSTMPNWQVANYGDDNARGLLGTLLAESCLNNQRWNEGVLRALLANLRTTGRLGFRGDRIDMPDIERNGWKYYHDASPVNYAPHFEAHLWACYLWAYSHTGENEFLDRTKTAISMTMKVFPKQWRWNDNMERARMLLALAWLVRVDDTPEHREWARRVAGDLISIQMPCGAIPEKFRGAGGGYQIPHSNEAYGTSETPLIQENGDPVTDQLYVTGFALLGFHEAAAVLRDAKIRAAEDKLAEYACRIQNRSKSLPYLAGTWFRAFDFDRWEAWASSGDAGWGAWSEEAGWAQAWTAGVLGLREMKTTLWEKTAGINLAPEMPKVRSEMAENQGGPWVPHARPGH